MDYLYRDSLHAGVPYGQNFDSPRLVRSLCLNEVGDRLAITHKGKTAAELMVFARYVMFSEVYWHHAVRSATAMFQRAFYLWHQQPASSSDASADVSAVASRLFRMRENEMIETMKSGENGHEVSQLLDALFGERRRFFKRIANYSCYESEEIYRRIAQAPYSWIVDCSQQLAALISQKTKCDVGEHRVLIDAPPVGLEVQFNVDVYFEKENQFRELGCVSPVVQTLARQQFDDFVKKVRVFIAPELASTIQSEWISDLVTEAIELTPQLSPS
jgi:HD superfamily phosphohydrolase